MNEARPEPRGLSLADLMILVAGVGLAFGLPEQHGRPHPEFFLNPQPSQVWALWLAHLGELGAKLGFGFGLAALFRCARYRRPIRAPEFLALHLAWDWAHRSIVTPSSGWLEFYVLTIRPNSWGRSPDYAVLGLWHSRWLAVGCVAAVCLVVRPIRRRLPSWFQAVLLLFAFQALTWHLASLSVFYPLARIQPSVDRVLLLASATYFLTTRPLPLAASLASLWRPARRRWSFTTWLAFALGIAVCLGDLARELIERFVGRNVSYMPPLTREGAAFRDLGRPALILAVEVALLIWLTRPRSGSRAEPTSTA